ncbi:MAG: thioredoxin family protein [Candidatus Methanomethyliaceae archaeon]|nr:thioredoxin family protein [Candidatus Methanomethyliaceae archaeon]MDW7970613.1 thioredoxin domain-containing protein [Nitrososphaerota archaeon]
MISVNWESWNEEVLKSKILTLVYFWQELCPWCRIFTPIFERVSKKFEGKVKFVRMNIFESDGNRELAEGLGIMSTPTLMFFCNGRPIMYLIGFMSEGELENIVNDMLNKHHSCLEKSSKISYM